MQVRYAASHVQHMQKLWRQMNVKLSEVLATLPLDRSADHRRDLARERDPQQLAALRDTQCHNDCHDRQGAGRTGVRSTVRLKTGYDLYQFITSK